MGTLGPDTFPKVNTQVYKQNPRFNTKLLNSRVQNINHQSSLFPFYSEKKKKHDYVLPEDLAS